MIWVCRIASSCRLPLSASLSRLPTEQSIFSGKREIHGVDKFQKIDYNINIVLFRCLKNIRGRESMSEKYDEIKAYLKEEALKPASRLRMPTIAELMRRFRASQSPVSRAVHDLEKEGILLCRRGTGIVSCAGSAPYEVRPAREKDRHANVVIFSVDYFASPVWQMEHTLNAYARQLGFTARNYRVQRNSDRNALIREIAGMDELKGVVLISTADRLEESLLQELGTLPCPVVILDSYFTYEDLPANIHLLLPDAEANGRLCVRCFREKHHRRIGFLRAIPDGTIPQKMIEAAFEEAKQSDMELSLFSRPVKSWESSRDAGRKVTLSFLEEIRDRKLTGLIYIGANGAFAGRRVLWEQKIRVPDEIGILAHGDDFMLADATPAISCTRTDFTAMSRDALDMIAANTPQPKEKYYPAVLIERESIVTPQTEN